MAMLDPIGPNDTIGRGVAALKYVLRSPIFGACNLVPQEGVEPADRAIGYVELLGAETKLLMAFYQDGQWRGRNLKPLGVPVARWYRMERADGQPVF
jgi:hypothetical protein